MAKKAASQLPQKPEEKSQEVILPTVSGGDILAFLDRCCIPTECFSRHKNGMLSFSFKVFDGVQRSKLCSLKQEKDETAEKFESRKIRIRKGGEILRVICEVTFESSWTTFDDLSDRINLRCDEKGLPEPFPDREDARQRSRERMLKAKREKERAIRADPPEYFSSPKALYDHCSKMLDENCFDDVTLLDEAVGFLIQKLAIGVRPPSVSRITWKTSEEEIESHIKTVREWSSEAVAFINLPENEQPSGPINNNAFRWDGNLYSGLTGLPYKLVNFLWSTEKREASFTDLASHVWVDSAATLGNDQVDSTIQRTKKFFDGEELPFEISRLGQKVCLRERNSTAVNI